MKKLTKICFAFFGFSLAFAGFLGIAKGSKKIEPVHATDPIIKLGDHNLKTDPLANKDDGFNGEAELETTEEAYILHLRNFNNAHRSNEMSSDTNVLWMANLDRNVIIELTGNNQLVNYDNTKAYGIGIKTSSEGGNYDISFVSADNEHPGSLSIAGAGGSSGSYGIFTSGKGNIIFDRCGVEIDGVTAPSVIGIQTAKDIIVRNGASLSINNQNVVSTGTNNCCINCGKFELQTGIVTLNAGAADTYGVSMGLSASHVYDEDDRYGIVVSGGAFTAYGGTTDTGVTCGVSCTADIKLDGGCFDVEGGVSSSGYSYGIAGSNTRTVKMFQGLESFYAQGYNKACCMKITPYYEGYGSNDTSIYDDESPTLIADDATVLVNYKVILFQKIIYEISYDPVVYDGKAHPAMTVTVEVPNSASDYTIYYLEDGSDEWKTTCPSYTNASDDPYVVDFLIEAPLYARAGGQVEFYITKGEGAIKVAPTKVADFTADGKEHELLIPGTSNGGTIMYSVNGGKYSADVPKAKDAGEYEISYKLVGDSNVTGIDPQSLGKVVVSAAPEPTPEPTPEEPAKKGLSGGAIAGIVIGSVVVAGVGGFALVWFVVLKKSWGELVTVFKKVPEFFKGLFKKKSE